MKLWQLIVRHRILLVSLGVIFAYSAVVVYAAGGPFSPHQTLDPNCLPTAGTCYVTNGGSSGQVLYTDSSGNTVSDANFTRNGSTQNTYALKDFGGGVIGGLYIDSNILGVGANGTTLSYGTGSTDTATIYAIDGTAFGAGNRLVGFAAVSGTTKSFFQGTPTFAVLGQETGGVNNTVNVDSSGIHFSGSGGSYTFPTGNASGVLTNDGSGNLSWTAPVSASSLNLSTPVAIANGGTNRVLYENNSGNMQTSSDFRFTDSTGEFDVGYNAGGRLIIQPSTGYYSIGDNNGVDHKTNFVVNDATQTYTFTKPNFNIDGIGYIFPSSQAGASGQVLTNDGSGNLSWALPSGPTGTATQIPYFDAGGLLTSDANFIHNPSQASTQIRESSGVDNGQLNVTSGGLDMTYHNTSNGGYWGFSVGNGTTHISANNSTWLWPNSDGTSGQVLSTDGSGNLSWVTASGSPGGSDKNIQFNNAGAFGGNANFTFDTNSGRFQASSAAGLGLGIVSDPSADRYVVGDYGGNANHFQIVLDDSAKNTSIFTPNGIFQAGDVAGTNNKTTLTVNDATQAIQFGYGTGSYTFPIGHGTNGQVITDNGSGVLHWAGAVAAAGGNNTDLQFNNSGVVSGTDSLNWDGSALNVHGSSGFYVAYPSNPSDNFHFTLPVGGLAPEVDFNVGGNRKVVFGYDDNLHRAIFHSDAYGGGMYIYNSNGIALGTNQAAYSGNAFYVEEPNHQIYTPTGIKLGVGGAPTYDLSVTDTATAGIVASFTNSNGSCTIDPTTSSVGCSSDQRLKKNITDLDSSDALMKVLSLQGVTYNWNGEQDTDPSHIGFVAQQVQQIFPQFVTTDAKGMLGVSYGSFAPVLAEAIKALNVKIQDISDLTNATNKTFVQNLIAFFANAENGIGSFFAGSVHTDQLCVGTRCMTPDEFNHLLDMEAAQQNTTTATSSPSSGDNTTGSSLSTTTNTIGSTTATSTTGSTTGSSGSTSSGNTTTTTTSGGSDTASSDTGSFGTTTTTTTGTGDTIGTQSTTGDTTTTTGTTDTASTGVSASGSAPTTNTTGAGSTPSTGSTSSTGSTMTTTSTTGGTSGN